MIASRTITASWATALFLGILIGAVPSDAQSTAPSGLDAGNPTLLVIPHTHWEGAVFKTREEYLEIGLPHILEALNLLERYPQYRFVLDQVAYVRPFLERYPEEEARFRRFVDEGRLQLTGAMITMMDVNMPSGESFIRHLLRVSQS